MMTEQRYEVIKKWGNFLFLFHGKEANIENKEKFKKLLQKIVLTNEFHWKTNQQTKSVDVSFAFGTIEIQTVANQFHVRMDNETKQALHSFKTGVQEGEKVTPQVTPPQEVVQKKDVVATKVANETKEVKPPLVEQVEQVQEKKEETEEIDMKNSIFLDFIGAEEREWM